MALGIGSFVDTCQHRRSPLNQDVILLDFESGCRVTVSHLYLCSLVLLRTAKMSKRLNKRQQREQEELELLKAEQQRASAATVGTASEEELGDDNDEVSEREDEEEKAGTGAPLNAFAAVSWHTHSCAFSSELKTQLGGDQGEDVDDEEDEDEELEREPEVVASSKKVRVIIIRLDEQSRPDDIET